MQRQSLQTCLVGLSLPRGLLADGVVYIREVVVMTGDNRHLGWHERYDMRCIELAYILCVGVGV